MQRLLKGNRGITLVALVISIALILILAGVTMSSLTTKDNLISRAKETKDAYRTGSQK